MSKNSTIKKVGMNGQISIGKEYAGQQVEIIKSPNGTLLITPGEFIPSSDLFLYKDNNEEKLMQALAESEKTPRKENFAEIEKLINEE